MSQISLFDSNSHPTLKGGWPTKGLRSSFKRLAGELQKNNYRGACAVGIWGLGGYKHEAYMRECLRYKKLIPIAGYFPVGLSKIDGDLAAIKKMGFKGIKIHPKKPAIALRDARLVKTFKAAARLKLPIFLCTYLHAPAKNYPAKDPLYELASLLRKAPKAKVVLVHGGDVNLLRYAELARFNLDLLMDLSLTFMKYRGSRIDLDIRFLFESFDERICIGTDFPEYTHRDVKKQFAKMARGIAKKKLENIAFRNIERFLEV